MSRGPATLATAIALALINLGLATLIVQVVSSGSFAPIWLGLALLVAGIAAGMVAVGLWRQYLNEARQR